MEVENTNNRELLEETSSISKRQSECLVIYRECGSSKRTGELLGIAQTTVARHLVKVARSRGLSDIRLLLDSPSGNIETKIHERTKRRGSDDANATSLLGLLEKQEYRCALSGISLNPSDAALDHKTPVSKGGSDSLRNLQWVNTAVNRAKGTLDNDEFILMCKRVASWNS
jgi:hypothetical protein